MILSSTPLERKSDLGAPPPQPFGRYLTELGPTGIKRIVRADGLPLGSLQPPRRHVRARVASDTVRTRVDELVRAAVVRRRRQRTTPKRPALPAETDPSQVPDGGAIRSRRERLDLSQRDFAAAAGISRGLLASVELGFRVGLYRRAQLAATLDHLERDWRGVPFPLQPRGEAAHA